MLVFKMNSLCRNVLNINDGMRKCSQYKAYKICAMCKDNNKIANMPTRGNDFDKFQNVVNMK